MNHENLRKFQSLDGYIQWGSTVLVTLGHSCRVWQKIFSYWTMRYFAAQFWEKQLEIFSFIPLATSRVQVGPYKTAAQALHLHYLPVIYRQQLQLNLLLSMETTIILPFSQLPFCPPKPCRSSKASPFRSWKQRISRPTRFNCQKMYVPGFGEASPEAKAAKNLHNFFNYIAVKIVTAQLQSYNPEAYKDLMEFLERHSLNDGDKFCADLMRESARHQSLALRILEVRSAYCKNDFEWDNLKRLAFKGINEANTKLMRDYVSETTRVESEK